MSLLSGRTCMPPGSSLTLAQATLLLSDLSGVQSSTLLKLTQKLLKKQVYNINQSMLTVIIKNQNDTKLKTLIFRALSPFLSAVCFWSESGVG